VNGETVPELMAEPARGDKEPANTDPQDKGEKLVDGGRSEYVVYQIIISSHN
jgi:hypothetical protein